MPMMWRPRTSRKGPWRSSRPGYLPALRFAALTPMYDSVVRWLTRERAVKAALLEAADLGRVGRMIDLGCGTGTFVIAVKRRYPGIDVVGLDPDTSVLERAAAKARRAGVDVAFVCGSATAVPMPDATFDRATSSLMFHHLPAAQKEKAAGEVDRLLVRDGEFHLADWVQPTNVLMHALFWTVRAFDGRETTADHAHGRLVQRLQRGGLVDVRQHRTFETPVGTVGLVSARPGRVQPRGRQ
jgi:ubiquinone/menaquinone biosynthesis C-methylase UbiE